MEITKRIIYLLHKRVRQELDVQELAELNAWSDRHPAFQQLLDEVSDEKNLTSALQAFDHVYGSDPAASIARMEGLIADGIQAVPEKRPQLTITRRLRKWFPYVAAILVMIMAATWIFHGNRMKQAPEIVDLKTEDIAPGGNRARLTLADGRTIDLSEEHAGIVISDEVTYLDGTVVESVIEETPLVLSTPKGGTYQLTLADGSKVWLNAASILKYPSRFSGDERIVELEGEGYFEIVKDPKRPFKVRSAGQEIAVLGTEFNISAYPDEAVTRTTLVAGAVQIVNLESKSIRKLTPGEQSVVAGSAMYVSKVDVEQYTAWKNGFFYFERLSTEDALTQLARWYDLDVVYEGKPSNTNVFAFIDRNKPLYAVLRSLEKSGLKFKITRLGGRTQLLVSENNK